MKLSLASVISFLSLTNAQSLLAALQTYPQCSQFLPFVPELLTVLPPGASNYTVLIPSNTALQAFGKDLAALPDDTRKTYLRYHILVGDLTADKLSAPRGLTIPTLLKDSLYNNRSSGPELKALYGDEADGQVVFIKKDLTAPGSAGGTGERKFRIRQVGGGGGAAAVRAGLAEAANLTAVDGKWDYGRFQIVDR